MKSKLALVVLALLASTVARGDEAQIFCPTSIGVRPDLPVGAEGWSASGGALPLWVSGIRQREMHCGYGPSENKMGAVVLLRPFPAGMDCEVYLHPSDGHFICKSKGKPVGGAIKKK